MDHLGMYSSPRDEAGPADYQTASLTNAQEWGSGTTWRTVTASATEPGRQTASGT